MTHVLEAPELRVREGPAPPKDAEPKPAVTLTPVPLSFQWQGYLQKRSDWLKHWETYYFVLRGRALYCYLSEEDARQQPTKSKIKKGKFGFSDRVTLVKVWDVDESEGASPSSADEAEAASSPFRFTLETEKGHQLHFRTNSEASKHVWLQFAATTISDFDAQGHLRPQCAKLRTSVDEFYAAYEYFYAALSDRVSFDCAAAANGVGSAAVVTDRSSFGSTSGGNKAKSNAAFIAVAPGQPIHNSHVRPVMDHVLTRLFSMLSPDVILRSNYLPMVPFQGNYRSFTGILDYFTRLSQSVQFEQFCVEHISTEEDESDTNRSSFSSSKHHSKSRVLVVSGRETMQVRYNQTTFMQQWTHKLHFKPADHGRISRWEIFGDVVASSVVFKAPGFSTNLTLPSLSERIRESFVGGYTIAIHLHYLTDVRSRDLRNDVRWLCCLAMLVIANSFGLMLLLRRDFLFAVLWIRTNSKACGTLKRSRGRLLQWRVHRI